MDDRLRARLQAVAAEHTALELLVLYGSRARGDERPGSDWDFAYLAGPAFDPGALVAELVAALGTEEVDVVDLERAVHALSGSATVIEHHLEEEAGPHGKSLLRGERRDGLDDLVRGAQAETVRENTDVVGGFGPAP